MYMNSGINNSTACLAIFAVPEKTMDLPERKGVQDLCYNWGCHVKCWGYAAPERSERKE